MKAEDKIKEMEKFIVEESRKSSTSTNKAKGRRLQNKVAEFIREFTGLPESDVKPAIMGEGGMDIKLSQQARKLFPYAVECKNQERMSFWSTIEQATNNAKAEGLKPLVVFKRPSMRKTYVIIEWEDFKELLEKSIDKDCQ